MKLYRYGGECGIPEISYYIENENENRLDVGLIDQYSLDRLARFINGGLHHITDLSAVEMALRGMIFHDSISSITPSATISIVTGKEDPFYTSISPNAEDMTVLQDVLTASGFSCIIGGIDQLLGFSDETISTEYLEFHEINRQRIIHERYKITNGNYTPPILDLTISPIELVANDKNEYFDSMFAHGATSIKRFLRPIATSGYAAYLGQPSLRVSYDGMRNYNAEQFFGVLDKEWQKYHDRLKRVLDIPIPLFLTIVLSRTKCRENIPEQISILRQEFATARRYLWKLFDEADFRIFDSSVAARNLEYIEKSAAMVIPKSLKANDFWFPIRFSWIGKLIEHNHLGLIKDIISYIKDMTFNNMIHVDAANLVQKQLESVEIKGLIEKHISAQELDLIYESIS